MANILLISYDNGSHIPFFPQNIFYLAGTLQKANHTVGIWFQDLHHGCHEALTKILDDNSFTIVGLGFCAGYWQYRKAKEIAEAISASKRRDKINFVLGGHGPAAEPLFFMQKLCANTVVIGDGEEAILQIAATDQKGIIEGEPTINDEAPLNAYKMFPMDIYRLIRWPTSNRTDFCFPILSSRGCKWSCSFCYRMREGFNERSIEAIIEEIKYLHNNHQINHFQFSDELLMSSEKRTLDICQAISELPFKIKWDCNGRLNFAKIEVLKQMKSSGCEYVNYGIESLEQTILNQMGKGLTIEQINSGVEATLDSGLSPGLNLLWGFPGDTVENLQAAVKFLIKYDTCHELRTIRPVTPYPGTPLYQKAINDGLLEGPEDFYERKHRNSDLFTVNFMDMPIKSAHLQLMSANEDLLENYMTKRARSMMNTASEMYLHGYTFRGFREV